MHLSRCTETFENFELFILSQYNCSELYLPILRRVDPNSSKWHQIDWHEEFYQGIHEEVMKLHRKHLKNLVKAVWTNIGAHITPLIKVPWVMNLRHEEEAGFRVAKTFGATQPNRTQISGVPPPPPPPTLHSTMRVVRFKKTHPRTWPKVRLIVDSDVEMLANEFVKGYREGDRVLYAFHFDISDKELAVREDDAIWSNPL